MMTTINQITQYGYERFCQEVGKRNFTKKTFKPNQYLLHQGQAITELYWIEIGQFSISYNAPNGRRFSLGLNFVEKHLFGENEFLTNSPCQFDIQASEYIEAQVIPVVAMVEILQQSPEIAIWLSSSMSQRYQDGMENTMNRFLCPLVFNIAWDIYQRHIGTKPSVNFSQVYKEAERFGTSERVYRRIINQLIDMEIIAKYEDELIVHDLDKLKKFVHQF